MIDSILTATDGPGGTAVSFSMFQIGENTDGDGALRLSLTGEMDLSVVDRLRERLVELQGSQRRVRLDLSGLEFIDCSSIGVILGALADSRRAGRGLELDRRVSPIAERVIALAELESALWPGVKKSPTAGDG